MRLSELLSDLHVSRFVFVRRNFLESFRNYLFNVFYFLLRSIKVFEVAW